MTAGLDHAGDHNLVVGPPLEQLRQSDGGTDRHAGDRLRPFIAEITTISMMVPMRQTTPRAVPNQTWNIRVEIVGYAATPTACSPYR